MAPFAHVLFGLLIRMDSFLPVPTGSGTSVLVALSLGLLLPALWFLGASGAGWCPAKAPGWPAGDRRGGATSTFDAATRAPRTSPTSSTPTPAPRPGPPPTLSRTPGRDSSSRPGCARGLLWLPNANPDWIKPAWTAPAPVAALSPPDVAVLERDRRRAAHPALAGDLAARGAPTCTWTSAPRASSSGPLWTARLSTWPRGRPSSAPASGWLTTGPRPRGGGGSDLHGWWARSAGPHPRRGPLERPARSPGSPSRPAERHHARAVRAGRPHGRDADAHRGRVSTAGWRRAGAAAGFSPMPALRARPTFVRKGPSPR